MSTRKPKKDHQVFKMTGEFTVKLKFSPEHPLAEKPHEAVAELANRLICIQKDLPWRNDDGQKESTKIPQGYFNSVLHSAKGGSVVQIVLTLSPWNPIAGSRVRTYQNHLAKLARQLPIDWFVIKKVTLTVTSSTTMVVE